jgi:hypothetical protein
VLVSDTRLQLAASPADPAPIDRDPFARPDADRDRDRDSDTLARPDGDPDRDSDTLARPDADRDPHVDSGPGTDSNHDVHPDADTHPNTAPGDSCQRAWQRHEGPDRRLRG